MNVAKVNQRGGKQISERLTTVQTFTDIVFPNVDLSNYGYTSVHKDTATNTAAFTCLLQRPSKFPATDHVIEKIIYNNVL